MKFAVPYLLCLLRGASGAAVAVAVLEAVLPVVRRLLSSYSQVDELRLWLFSALRAATQFVHHRVRSHPYSLVSAAALGAVAHLNFSCCAPVVPLGVNLVPATRPGPPRGNKCTFGGRQLDVVYESANHNGVQSRRE